MTKKQKLFCGSCRKTFGKLVKLPSVGVVSPCCESDDVYHDAKQVFRLSARQRAVIYAAQEQEAES